jgi:hypothetical protein
MRAGYLLDKTQPSAFYSQGENLEWIAGEAGKKSFWRQGVRLAGKERRNVVTYRCAGCGYLESYAVDDKA